MYTGLNDSQYGVDMWLGVRYAQPPVGPLRLQPAQEYEAKGVVVSQSPGKRCFQISTNGAQSEDCLFLNIFTPARACRENKKLPVMLWIHGGGFNQGSANDYNAAAIVNRSVELKSPVIVVAINYRLSFFGFSGTWFLLIGDFIDLRKRAILPLPTRL
jgi:carboxylesterase type B